ncbi:hypothetical protein BJV78DRAFT_219274 [Lactifluus subvellereus]|nr:hypothetical protein BJV78DRAFT_219274 [Lactifluus subvellereus]
MAEPNISSQIWPTSDDPSRTPQPRHGLSGTSLTLTIEALPEDVLLEIFDFYKLASITLAWGWYKLVHVCRRWRYVIFASQHRLDLRLLCTYGTPVRKTLDCWPALPIIIRYRDATNRFRPPSSDDEDNIIAALRHCDRVCEIDLIVEGSLFVKLSALMQEPFPSLECLVLSSRHNADLVLPNAFLGGSVPRLRNLYLDVIAFPALPQLLRSAKDLVHLHLQRIPGRGYISPEALIASLSAMTKLKVLRMHFTSPTSGSTPPPPPAGRGRGVVLPSLTHLAFRGASEYLEDVVARIGSAPCLERTCVSFFNQPTFEIPRLAQFLNHAESTTAGAGAVGQPGGEAKLLPRRDGISIALIRTGERTAPMPGDPSVPPRATGTTSHGTTSREWLRLDISCGQSGRQLSSMTQVCRQIFPLLSGVQKLDVLTSSFAPPPPIARVSRQGQGQGQGQEQEQEQDDDDEEDADAGDADANATTGRRWLGLLHMFSGVQVLRVGYGSVPDVARALQQHVSAAGSGSGSADSGSADVLPALRELYFDWFASRWDEAVAPFLTARQLSGRHPITYHRPKSPR